MSIAGFGPVPVISFWDLASRLPSEVGGDAGAEMGLGSRGACFSYRLPD
jgi:hypothetical protein